MNKRAALHEEDRPACEDSSNLKNIDIPEKYIDLY